MAIWSADGYPGWSADGYPGWSADGFITSGSPIIPPPVRVRVVRAGYYAGEYRNIGDVFDIASITDYSDSTMNLVPIGNPDYPLYGWMLQVPPTTPLYNYARVSGSASTARFSPRRTVL